MAKRITVKSLVNDDKTVEVISHQLRINKEMQGDGDVKVIPLDKVHPNALNPREITFSADDISRLAQERDTFINTITEQDKREQLIELLSLADSIAHSGLIQPILVTNHPQIQGEFMVVAGERRYWSHILLGRSAIRAIYRRVDEKAHRSLSIAENLARNDLTLKEKVSGLKALVSIDADFLKADHVMRLFGVRKSTAYQLIKAVKEDSIFQAVINDEIKQFRDIDSFGQVDFPTVGNTPSTSIPKPLSDRRKKTTLTLNETQVKNLAAYLGIDYNPDTIHDDIIGVLS